MSAQRMLFFMISAMLTAGIGLTGWDQVHWLLYVPPIMLVFSGVTGFCPALFIFNKVGLK